MVKASEGGGGKGIRMSHSDEDMRSHFVQVGSEGCSVKPVWGLIPSFVKKFIRKNHIGFASHQVSSSFNHFGTRYEVFVQELVRDNRIGLRPM